jgi:POT family proton-dependent oligopeptide transporter
MLIGLAVYLHGRKWLPQHQPLIAAEPGTRTSLSRDEWKTTLVLVAMLPILAAALLGNQQMFNMFIVWGEANFDLQFLGYEMPVTWLLSIDAAIAVVLLSLAIVFWRWYGQRWKEPEDIVKIAIGAGIMASAPLLLMIACLQQVPGTRISLGWGLAFEIANETGFVILVPIALSLFSRAAPKQIEGLTIGMFYLAFFLCNVVVGRLGGLLEQMDAADFWLMHAVIVGGAAAVLAGLALWGRGLFGPVESPLAS